MLPVVRDDDCDAIYLLLVTFYESSMIFEGRDILPAVEPGGINQQPDLAVPADDRIDLRRNLAKIVGLNLSGTKILNTLREIMSVLIT